MRAIVTAVLMLAAAPARAFEPSISQFNDPCLDWLSLPKHAPAAGLVYGDCLKRAVEDPSIKVSDPYLADVVEWLRSAPRGR